jgi:hypothetical protein
MATSSALQGADRFLSVKIATNPEALSPIGDREPKCVVFFGPDSTA